MNSEEVCVLRPATRRAGWTGPSPRVCLLIGCCRSARSLNAVDGCGYAFVLKPGSQVTLDNRAQEGRSALAIASCDHLEDVDHEVVERNVHLRSFRGHAARGHHP